MHLRIINSDADHEVFQGPKIDFESRVAFDDHERVDFLNNFPGGILPVAKKPIHDPHRPVTWGGPSTFKQPSVMKGHQAPGYHESAPIVPVFLHHRFGMVSVDHQ